MSELIAVLDRNHIILTRLPKDVALPPKTLFVGCNPSPYVRAHFFPATRSTNCHRVVLLTGSGFDFWDTLARPIACRAGELRARRKV